MFHDGNFGSRMIPWNLGARRLFFVKIKQDTHCKQGSRFDIFKFLGFRVLGLGFRVEGALPL